jgi:hypothetical protein
VALEDAESRVEVERTEALSRLHDVRPDRLRDLAPGPRGLPKGEDLQVTSPSPTLSTPVGLNKLTAVARDAAGNVTTSPAIIVTLGN